MNEQVFADKRRAQDRLEAAIEERIQAGHAAAVEALRALVKWVPECEFPKNIKPAYDERPERGTPFCSEAYTYEVWGKDDARTFLALVGAIARGLGAEDLAP